MKNKLPDMLPADPRWDFSILRHLRKQFAWSIADLSEHSQVAASVISKLERNRSKAEIDTLYKIAQAFSMTLSDLFALAEKRTAQHNDDGRCRLKSPRSFPLHLHSQNGQHSACYPLLLHALP